MRALVIAVVALAALSVAAPAADAQTVKTYAQAQTIDDPTTTTRSHHAVECVAIGPPDTLGIGISDCYLHGMHTGAIHRVGDRDALPRFVDVSAGVLTNVLSEPFEVCVRARALLADQSFYETPLRCATTTLDGLPKP